MSIPITPEIEQLVHGIYAGGAYASEADVLAAALHLLRQRDELRIKLREGIDELDRGERLTSDQVFRELRKRAVKFDGPAA
jgi:Arc/MetJ-type ribon-helix-helix transcriptional regulator